MAPKDALLITRVRYRDRLAIAEAARCHSGFLTAIAVPLVGTESAQAVVVRSWIKAIEELSRFDGRSSLRIWVGRFVLAEARVRRRREGVEVRRAEWGLDSGSPIAERFGPDGRWRLPPKAWGRRGPDRMRRQEALGSRLAARSGELPPEEQIVFRLVEFESVVLEEIAELMNITTREVRVLLYRARQRLHGVLSEFEQAKAC